LILRFLNIALNLPISIKVKLGQKGKMSSMMLPKTGQMEINLNPGGTTALSPSSP
jgi:hypothetical protein